MPFFDWLEARGVRPEWFSGSVGVTIGDSLNGTFGASHAHVFGADVKLVCDPEDLIMGRLESVLPLTAGLLSGVGGTTTFVYGSNTGATYVGPKMDICRAESINKTSDNILAHVRKKPEDGGEETDEIDIAMSVAVAAFSVVMCATAAALDLAIRFQYEEMQNTKSAEQKKHCEETIEKLKIASYTVTGRIMALLKTLEEKGSWAEFAKQWLKEAKGVGLLIEHLVLAAIPMYGWTALIILYEEENMKKTVKDAWKALKD